MYRLEIIFINEENKKVDSVGPFLSKDSINEGIILDIQKWLQPNKSIAIEVNYNQYASHDNQHDFCRPISKFKFFSFDDFEDQILATHSEF